MNAEDVYLLQIWLAAWLQGTVVREAREVMKMTKVETVVIEGRLLPAFDVLFASGTKLRVGVTVLDKPPEAALQGARK